MHASVQAVPAPYLAALAAYNLCFALFHLSFWRLFAWPASLRASGSINTSVTQTLNLMLTYCLIAYGGWLSWAAISGVPVPAVALLVGGGFWGIRLIIQPILFNLPAGPSTGLTLLFSAGAAAHVGGSLLAWSA